MVHRCGGQTNLAQFPFSLLAGGGDKVDNSVFFLNFSYPMGDFLYEFSRDAGQQHKATAPSQPGDHCVARVLGYGVLWFCITSSYKTLISVLILMRRRGKQLL